MGTRAKIDWGSVDWGKQDIELSIIHACSRERVRQMRAKLGKGKPLGYRQRTGETAESRIAMLDTAGMTAGEVAEVVGCGQAYARAAMGRLGKGYKRLPNGKAKYDWGLLPSNWRDLTDKEMAGIVGATSPAVVTQWRMRHGMRKRGQG